ITDIRNGMSDEDCGQEELIGWLYQFYIADKKDDVFEGLKKNIKITAENIPAATQLFTPRWIVRYMVENTLGKQWLTLKPNSKLRQFMPYYIEAPEGNAPAPLPEGIKGVTDITFLDPCQGSGHVLVYAFDLFTKIYEEEGYNTNEIPALILEHNLFGIDIDERAAQLAAFALTMKARSYFARFLRKPVQPHVIALENVNEDIIKQAVKLPLQVAGKLVYDYRDLTLYNLTKADNFGSLIQIDPEELKALSIQKGSIWQAQEQKLKEQAEYLSHQYHCVVTNPPYMGGKGMNDTLRGFIDLFYKAGKADLMTCFMQRCIDFVYENCSYGMINLPSWLFLTSFEELRKELISNSHIDSLLHMGRGIFGIDFGSVAFTISKSSSSTKGFYFRLHQRNFQHIYYNHIEQLFLRAKKNPAYRYDFSEYRDSEGVSEIPFESNKSGMQLYYEINQKDYEKIPGYTIAYWLSPKMLETIDRNKKVIDICEPKAGLQTGKNEKYLRNWFEINLNNIDFHVQPNSCGLKKFVCYNKAGGNRKWYGYNDYVILYERDGELLRNSGSAVFRNFKNYYQESISWSLVTSGSFSVRYYEQGYIFDNGAPSIHPPQDIKFVLLAFLNSKVAFDFLKTLNPTLNFQVGNISALPIKIPAIDIKEELNKLTEICIGISKNEWNSRETSYGFESHPLSTFGEGKIIEHYKSLFEKQIQQYNTLQISESKLNALFIKDLELQDELEYSNLTQEILLFEQEIITNDQGELIPNIQEISNQLISYSVGCMFGRYSLDKPGLILANQSESLQDFIKQIPSPSFMPDEDNIIPVLEGEWFNDDIVGRFKVFLKAAFGEEHFEENLQYIEDTIGKDIRKYFVKDFYNDHIKRYKKRPIYWMFSSPKGHFKALIYMHRYTSDLCSKMLTDYLQSYINKLEAAQQNKIAESLREDLPARDRTAATKEADRFAVMIKDCKEYAQTLYAVATKKITIDLDDGVKVNYQKFKEVLVPIKGLEKDEE
ncbi:MAG: BREX-1 system adenine-specific DNA-methyltransferase PglX, partial [Bacteroidia bacterium]|nr:BREX-1 system adenine-specific DNA-methyltransferase PglX [Bacteroidia bacterium]